ncbi:hypothetical protein HS048_34420 [Planomonospora sp. ID91781]|uniref:hypothetical protein n=1 Tax=Planomonospora sp. ID91781 TaxID=2738135 RepID=UPI0018C3A348|nr:hypothetical protein [Planomonospora sp. ID91781]MBG0825782.1 hypothetical protein [Planomonospora sp. ID91781]
MTPLVPSSLLRAGCILALTVLAAACAQESAKPFDAMVRMAEVAPGGRVITLHASGSMRADGTICTVVERAEVVESPTSVTVGVVLRRVCPERSGVQVGTGTDHAVPVTLKKPLDHRKVLDQEGHEIQVCPTTTGSFVETLRRCLEEASR